MADPNKIPIEHLDGRLLPKAVRDALPADLLPRAFAVLGELSELFALTACDKVQSNEPVCDEFLAIADAVQRAQHDLALGLIGQRRRDAYARATIDRVLDHSDEARRLLPLFEALNTDDGEVIPDSTPFDQLWETPAQRKKWRETLRAAKRGRK